MAYSSPNSRPLRGSGQKQFDFNLRTYKQICNRKQGHADVANIYSERFNIPGFGEHTDRGIEQLASLATPVLAEVSSEKHWRRELKTE
jgi:hypothetical protein